MRKLLFECFPEHLLWDTLAVRDTALRRPDKSERRLQEAFVDCSWNELKAVTHGRQ